MVTLKTSRHAKLKYTVQMMDGRTEVTYVHYSSDQWKTMKTERVRLLNITDEWDVTFAQYGRDESYDEVLTLDQSILGYLVTEDNLIKLADYVAGWQDEQREDYAAN